MMAGRNYHDSRKHSAKAQLAKLAEQRPRTASNRHRRSKVWAQVQELVDAGFTWEQAKRAFAVLP
jgi:hypothetical protein